MKTKRTPLKAVAFIGTPSQDKALAKLKHFMRKHTSSDPNYSEPVVTNVDNRTSFIRVSLRVLRIDCEEYSPRARLCDLYLYAFIGKRGKIEVCRFTDGDMDSTKHAQLML